MTFDEFRTAAQERGLHILNVMQLEGGRWQANVRRGLEAFSFGRGDTAETAFSEAIREYDKALALVTRHKETRRGFEPAEHEDVFS